MPLYEERAEVIGDGPGDTLIACVHCHKAADDKARTVGEFPFMLMCPFGKVTLGEWATELERTNAIADFLQRRAPHPALRAVPLNNTAKCEKCNRVLVDPSVKKCPHCGADL